MINLKQYIYHYRDDNQLIRIPVTPWQRILSQEQAVPAYQDMSIRIVYSYVEMFARRPVYCHRIETVRYKFDSDGFYSPLPIPDLDMLAGIAEDKISYLSVKKNKNAYFSARYWELTPVLLDNILEKIWSDPR